MKAVVTNTGACVDLILRQGSDFSTTIKFSNADGTPVDLTGSSGAAQIRKKPLDTSVVASFIVTITAPAAGTCVMSMPASDSADIVCGNAPTDDDSIYTWDLKLTDSLGEVSSPLFGNVAIFRAVTR